MNIQKILGIFFLAVAIISACLGVKNKNDKNIGYLEAKISLHQTALESAEGSKRLYSDAMDMYEKKSRAALSSGDYDNYFAYMNKADEAKQDYLACDDTVWGLKREISNAQQAIDEYKELSYKWFTIAVITGIVGAVLLVLGFISAAKETEQQLAYNFNKSGSALNNTQTDNSEWNCPKCGKTNSNSSRVCKDCGYQK